MAIIISRALLETVLADARADPRHERCGLLLGGDGVITGHLPATNVAPHPASEFEIDPVALIAAHRAARSGGPAVLGHYHCHPNGSTTPSKVDAAASQHDGKLWLIISMLDKNLWIEKTSGYIHQAFDLAQLRVLDADTPLPAANPDR